MNSIPDFLFGRQLVWGRAPTADNFAGGVLSDVINLKYYNTVHFLILTGAIEDACVSNLVTLLACDDTTPSNTTAMPFYRRSLRWSTTNDAWQQSSPTLVAAAGYNFTLNNAVANAIHVVSATGAMVEQAAPGYEYVQLSIAETANKTVLGGILVFLEGARYAQGAPLSVIA